MQQYRGDRRVHAAGQPADNPFGTHLLADLIHGPIDKVGHGPVGFEPADSEQEIAQDFIAARRVSHFGMKLNPEKPARTIVHGRHGRIAAVGDGAESGRRRFDPVAMAHPDSQGLFFVVQSVEQVGRVVDGKIGRAVFAVSR